jgi:hypothetical protein
MALNVKPISVVAPKWVQRASAASGAYKDGVQGAGSAWQSAVDNAEQSWSTGVNTAAANHEFTRGVNGKASQYVDRAVNVGAGRYPGGIAAGQNKYTQNMGKVLAIEASLNPPPRGAVGSNSARADYVSNALHQAKVSGQTKA